MNKKELLNKIYVFSCFLDVGQLPIYPKIYIYNTLRDISAPVPAPISDFLQIIINFFNLFHELRVEQLQKIKKIFVFS